VTGSKFITVCGLCWNTL